MRASSTHDPALGEALGLLAAVIAEICGAKSGSSPDGFAYAAAQLERGHSLTPIHSHADTAVGIRAETSGDP